VERSSRLEVQYLFGAVMETVGSCPSSYFKLLSFVEIEAGGKAVVFLHPENNKIL
jgi:hypothetical protein